MSASAFPHTVHATRKITFSKVTLTRKSALLPQTKEESNSETKGTKQENKKKDSHRRTFFPFSAISCIWSGLTLVKLDKSLPLQ